MRVALAYIFPQLNFPKYEPLAQRFVDSYMTHPPGQYPHTVHVIANGYDIGLRQRNVFGPLPVTHMTHNNYGQDIGAFIMASDVIPCDLLVCLGAHVHFRRAGWLDRLVNAYLDNGPGLYGAWGFHEPARHLRTTSFWCSPEILNTYPYEVGNPQRYAFEHSPDRSIVAHTAKMGFPTLMVTWAGTFEPKDWRHVENRDCLMLDQHTDSIGYV